MDEKHKEKIREVWNKGKKLPYVTERNIKNNPMNNLNSRKKMILAKKGCIPWNKGLKLGPQTSEWKEKISKNNSGNKHHNWQGGKSFEPYSIEFDNRLKHLIREKYSFKCQMCGIEESLLTRKLVVHHIDGNKLNSSIDNLIPLCISCHVSYHNLRRK